MISNHWYIILTAVLNIHFQYEYTFSHFMELTRIVNDKHIFSLEILTLEKNLNQRSPSIIKAQGILNT